MISRSVQEGRSDLALRLGMPAIDWAEVGKVIMALFASAGLGGILSAAYTNWAQRPRTQAEVRKMEADAESLQATTITRLIEQIQILEANWAATRDERNRQSMTIAGMQIELNDLRERLAACEAKWASVHEVPAHDGAIAPSCPFMVP